MQIINKDLRRKILQALIKEIESGQFYYNNISPQQLYQMHTSQRYEYLAPRENSTFNLGQMIWDMDAGMDEAF